MTETDICRERHARIERDIEKTLDGLARCDRRAEELAVIAERTGVLLEKAAESLDSLEKRVAAIEARPIKRLSTITDEILKWAIFLALGALAVRAGLS